MEITRMVSIVENEKIYIKQTDCSKFCLNYDNVRIVFNKGAMLKFLIEVDDWCIKNQNNKNAELNFKAGRFTLNIKKKDMDEFLKAVNDTAYNLIPILKAFKQMNSGDVMFRNRMN